VTLLFLILNFIDSCFSQPSRHILDSPAMPSSDMWQECQITFQHSRPCYAKSSYRSVDPQTLHGNVHQVDHVPNGPTNCAATTTMFPLRLCGGKPLVAVTRERRYGPSRLRVDDDDDDEPPCSSHAASSTRYYRVSRYFFAIIIVASKRWYRPRLVASSDAVTVQPKLGWPSAITI